MTAWLLTWFWQGSTLAGGVAVALGCVPRMNASTRHLIWCGALAAVAWLGWASSPYWGLPPVAVRGSDPIYVPTAPDFLITIGLGIWAAIALVNLLRLLPGLRAVYALRDRCSPVPPSLESRLPLWLEAKARGRRTQLTLCDAVPGATVLGFERPCIAIPSSLVEALTIDELDQVILHEYAHVQRRDDWSRLAQTLLLSVLWIHPAALVVSRVLNREREMACDEWVVARTGLPKAYARCLARAAEARIRMTRGSTLVPALIGGRHELERRVDRLLAARGKARRNVSLTAVSVAACAMVMGSMQFQGAHWFAEIAEIVFPTDQVQMVQWMQRVREVQTVRWVQRVQTVSEVQGVQPVRPATAPIAPDLAPIAPDLAPIAPTAPVAPPLSARIFIGAYSDAPVAPLSPLAPIAPVAPDRWKMASAAKKTSVGIANAFSRAGVSLARSF
jgi:beta-lactamase regulating signal transducer with metallopeptidase domain